MSVDLKTFFSNDTASKIQPKQQAVENGAILEHNGQRFAIQMLYINASQNLYIRMFNETDHEIRWYHQGNKTVNYIGDTTTFNNPKVMDVLIRGDVVDNAPKIDFKGTLKPLEEQFYQQHPKMAPNYKPAPPPSHKKEWTMTQMATGGAVIIGLSYLVLKAKKRYNVQLPELPPAMQKKIDQVREWWKRTPKTA